MSLYYHVINKQASPKVHASRELKQTNSKPAYLLALKGRYAVGSAAGFLMRSFFDPLFALIIFILNFELQIDSHFPGHLVHLFGERHHLGCLGIIPGFARYNELNGEYHDILTRVRDKGLNR